MEEILAKGPWIVSNKHMSVQKWDPIIGMERVDVTKIPVWAKIRDVPLEAWTKEGISALASSLGKPIRMDNITAQNCKDGKGRAEYARVLVEFDVDKGFKEEICIQYRSKDNVIRGTKKVKVEYDKMKNKESIDVDEVSGFTQVRYRKNFEAKRNDRIGMNQYGGSKRNVWNNNGVYKKKDKAVGSIGDNQIQGKKGSTTKQNKADNTARVSQNMFAPLDDMSEKHELNVLKDRMIVDQYLNKKLQPTCAETTNWSKDMISYFKQKWDENRLKEAEENNEKNEDVLIGENIAAQRCSANDVNGEETSILN
ncbi:ATPase, F1/V1/A1 complex, alpha/beta subunit [Tanacetum coccineum]